MKKLFNQTLFLILVFSAVVVALGYMLPAYLLVIYGNDGIIETIKSGVFPLLMDIAMIYLILVLLYGFIFLIVTWNDPGYIKMTSKQLSSYLADREKNQIKTDEKKVHRDILEIENRYESMIRNLEEELKPYRADKALLQERTLLSKFKYDGENLTSPDGIMQLRKTHVINILKSHYRKSIFLPLIYDQSDKKPFIIKIKYKRVGKKEIEDLSLGFKTEQSRDQVYDLIAKVVYPKAYDSKTDKTE